MRAVATKENIIRVFLGLICVCIVVSGGYSLYLLSEWYFKTPSHLGAIVSNGAECAAIGRQMIKEGGSAADSIISVLLCEGVVSPHALGIGGGFLATIYNKEKGIVESLVAREMAPAASYPEMFVNMSSLHGATTVAIPGELKGYWELHQKYGKLPWKRLFEPAIQLCVKGVPVTNFMWISMLENEKIIKEEPTLRSVFTDPVTNELKPLGSFIFRPTFAATLKIISEQGADAFYFGEVGRNLVRDLKARGGILTNADLANYKVKWTSPTQISLKHGYTVYSTPLPGGGAILSLILNLMNDLSDNLTSEESIFWHRLTESFKHAYGRRPELADIDVEPQVAELYANMTDPDFALSIKPSIYDSGVISNMEHYGIKYTAAEDHGTAAMSVLHPNGDAISITSTINDNFGSKIRSLSTGIILNDNMDDFSSPGATNYYGYPPTPLNFIKPGKRPLSSMVPSIILDKNRDVRMLIGAAGGSKIPTSVAQVILRYLFMNEPLYQTVQSPRLHHQLQPKLLKYEEGFSTKILDELERKGHILKKLKSEEGFAALTAIGAKTDTPEPVFDNRRGGSGSIVSLCSK